MVRMVLPLVLLALCLGCTRQEPESVIVDNPPEPPPVAPEAQADRGEVTQMQITSSAFAHGATIPRRYTGDGEDVSPPLSFAGVPDEAAELVLICHDPDAPRAGGWTHWVVYGMAPDLTGLPEAIPAEPRVSDPALVQGENSWGRIGYGGPAPPPGKPHRYQFRLYAVRNALNLEPGATKDQVEAAMKDQIVAEAMLEGLYGR